MCLAGRNCTEKRATHCLLSLTGSLTYTHTHTHTHWPKVFVYVHIYLCTTCTTEELSHARVHVCVCVCVCRVESIWPRVALFPHALAVETETVMAVDI